MKFELGLKGETPQLAHQVRVLGALVSIIEGRPTSMEVAELVEGWSDVPSVLAPRAREAILDSDQALAAFLVRDVSPYL